MSNIQLTEEDRMRREASYHHAKASLLDNQLRLTELRKEERRLSSLRAELEPAAEPDHQRLAVVAGDLSSNLAEQRHAILAIAECDGVVQGYERTSAKSAVDDTTSSDEPEGFIIIVEVTVEPIKA